MRYPVTLTPAEEGGFVVTFPDVPEAITQGDDRASTLEMALDALITSLDFYFENRRHVPAPSRVRRGDDSVELPPSVVAKVLLLNAMIADQVRPIDLAKRMVVTRQEVLQGAGSESGAGDGLLEHVVRRTSELRHVSDRGANLASRRDATE